MSTPLSEKEKGYSSGTVSGKHDIHGGEESRKIREAKSHY
jgi:hypothetical protein